MREEKSFGAMEDPSLQSRTMDRNHRFLQARCERHEGGDASMFEREPLKGEMDRISKEKTNLKLNRSGCASRTKGNRREPPSSASDERIESNVLKYSILFARFDRIGVEEGGTGWIPKEEVGWKHQKAMDGSTAFPCIDGSK